MERLGPSRRAGSLELQPFERGRRSLLAAPLSMAPGLQVGAGAVRQERPTEPAASPKPTASLAAAAADFGTEMLRQALAERQTHRVLFDAVAGGPGRQRFDGAIAATAGQRPAGDPPPAAVMAAPARRAGRRAPMRWTPTPRLRLAESIRVLAVRHGIVRRPALHPPGGKPAPACSMR